MSDKKVLVYGAPWCAFCHTAIDYLKSKGVDSTYIDVDQDPTKGLEAIQKSGQRGIPVLDIGGDIVVGYDRPRIDEALRSHSLV